MVSLNGYLTLSFPNEMESGGCIWLLFEGMDCAAEFELPDEMVQSDLHLFGPVDIRQVFGVVVCKLWVE